jgi:protein-disulfide isomerase
LFTKQSGENTGAFSAIKLNSFAKIVDLDTAKFDACMNNKKFAERVTQDGADGVNAGIEATPSFILSYVVNGETKTRMIKGAQPFATFQGEIDAALVEMGLQ